MKNYLIMAGIAIVITGLGIVLFVKPAVVNNLSAVSNPDINSPYFSFGGVRQWAGVTQTLAQASTTCSIQSPAATSTLIFASLRVASTSASASLIEMGKAATAYATTTLLGTATIAANAQGTVIASSTISGLDPTTTFAPNQYFNVKVTGNSQYGGTCEAIWIQNAY